jgi:DNA-binding response OmpR family regulator
MAEAKTSARLPAPILEGLRVLIVEDDQDILRMMALVVDAAGASVAAASSGHEGYRLLESRPFDVVVLDWNLTDVAGGDFVARLHREFVELASRTLVVTGDLIRSGIEHEATGLGCRVLVKPFKPPALVETVAELTGRRPTAS